MRQWMARRIEGYTFQPEQATLANDPNQMTLLVNVRTDSCELSESIMWPHNLIGRDVVVDVD